MKTPQICLLFSTAFLVTFLILKSASPMLATVSLCLVSAVIADCIVKIVKNALPRKNLPDIDRKAILVTGCDSGFGQQMAQRLDEMGAQVFAGCLFPKGDGASELKSKCSNRLRILPLDVTSNEQVEAAARFVSAELGEQPLWCVVNNAGVAVTTEVEWCPLEAYGKMWDVNALGAIRVTKAFLPLVRKRPVTAEVESIGEGGRMVYVTSLAGRYTFPGFTAYSMSKSAICSFADGLRREMKKWSITVHTIEPSLYRTTISEENVIKGAMQKCWESCSEDIQSNYGEQYFEDFKNGVLKILKRARPKSMISEVVDDMLDAAIGEQPKSRYVPSLTVQLRAKILMSLPTDVLDYVMCMSQPKTPPAAVSKVPPLKNPYSMVQRKIMKRHASMPLPEKHDPKELIDDGHNTKFVFPEEVKR